MKEIILNDKHRIKVNQFRHEKVDELDEITVKFPVTSEEYHDITVLLYEGTFDVKVPELELGFKGAIEQYYTSITDLYKEDQVGDFTLTLREVKVEE